MSNTNQYMAIDFKQNGHNYMTAVMTSEVIDRYSEVLVYGKSPGGYQREPEPNHYNKIKDYILKEKDFLLPTSIILAIDESEIGMLTRRSGDQLRIVPSQFPPTGKIFRIVDGQHRIIAMREAAKTRPELKKFLFSVIILFTKPKKRSLEMETFYYINSKGKRLKVDLIELARFNYRILEQSFREKEVNEHISIQVAYFLNEQTPGSVWCNAIKFGIHDDHVVGLIGVNAFRESISGIVDAYLRIHDRNRYRELSGERLIEYSEKSAKKIADFLHKAWDLSVKSKWKFCFKEGETQVDIFQEPKVVYYSPKYYLQRTMGAKAINGIFSNVVNGKEDRDLEGLNRESLRLFDQLITRSKITGDDWQLGGTFAGYSSESGFKKVSQIVLNKLNVTRSFK